MDDERIDFSSLDPSRDTASWERRIEAVVRRAAPARARPSETLLGQLAAWWRPALAGAVGVALAVCGAAAVRGDGQKASVAAPKDAEASFVAWAIEERGDASIWEQIAELGGSDDGR